MWSWDYTSRSTRLNHFNLFKSSNSNPALTTLFASLKLCGSFSYFSGETKGRRTNRRAQDTEEEGAGPLPPGERARPESQGFCTQLYWCHLCHHWPMMYDICHLVKNGLGLCVRGHSCVWVWGLRLGGEQKWNGGLILSDLTLKVLTVRDEETDLNKLL